MILSLGEICSMATNLVAGRLDLQLSEVSLYANLAYEELATTQRFAALEAIAVSSTTSGENRVALPSDFGYALNVVNTTMQRTLTPRPAMSFDSASTSLGEPVQFAQYGTWLELWPSPDSSYSVQLRYQQKVGSLVSSVDTPVIDSRFHMGIVYKTAQIASAMRNDVEAEAANRARFVDFMGSRPNDHDYRQRAVPGAAQFAWK